MLTREQMTQAVKLKIMIDKGFYHGITLREKLRAIESLTKLMNVEQYEEYIKRWRS